MASHSNYSYPFNGEGSDPGYNLYQDMYQYLEAPAQSVAMYRDYSDESYGSTRSRYSRATGGSSPTTAMKYDTPSPNYGDDNYDSNYNAYPEPVVDSIPRQALLSIPEQTQRPSLRGRQGRQEDRHTPTSLGWPLDQSPVDLYAFVFDKPKEPYLDLLPGHAPSAWTPKRVYLDQPKTHNKKPTWFCQFPGPCGKRFKRFADLERHYSHVHADAKYKLSLPCDYAPCDRSKPGNVLNRKDHLRDHYREYHKEDIGHAKHTKHGKRMSGSEIRKADQAWKEERVNDPKWWRCPKDLVRVYVAEQGWVCGLCNQACEPERKQARISKSERRNIAAGNYEEPATAYGASVCPTCDGAIWDWNPCSNCYMNNVPDQVANQESNHVWQQPATYKANYSTY